MRLILDTVSGQNQFALITEDGKVTHKTFDRRTESGLLLSELSGSLSNLNSSTAQVSELSVNVGPGSFTGIKVGLSIAQTFSLVHSTKLSAFTSFDILASKAQMNNIAFSGILIYAYQHEYFSASLVDKSWLFKLMKSSEIPLGEWLYDGPSRYASEAWYELPQSADLDWNQFVSECNFDAEICPFYGKKSTAEMNAAKTFEAS